MELVELLTKNRPAIVKGWLERTLRTYPSDATAFFAKNDDRFTNPVGRTLAVGIEALFDALVDGDDPERLCSHLDPIMQLRAVQEFTPARAVSFVFMLKDTVREVLDRELGNPGPAAGLHELDTRIDQLALFAFDIYCRHRQRMYEIRVEEIKRRVYSLMKRSDMFELDPDDDPERDRSDAKPSNTHRGGDP